MILGDFSSFWQFSTELDDAERILKADAVGARSGAFVGDFDSKKMCGQALFPCPVGHEVGDELALIAGIGG